jgi:hypothetical protein
VGSQGFTTVWGLVGVSGGYQGNRRRTRDPLNPIRFRGYSKNDIMSVFWGF